MSPDNDTLSQSPHAMDQVALKPALRVPSLQKDRFDRQRPRVSRAPTPRPARLLQRRERSSNGCFGHCRSWSENGGDPDAYHSGEARTDAVVGESGADEAARLG